jgi:hypothetical protein
MNLSQNSVNHNSHILYRIQTSLVYNLILDFMFFLCMQSQEFIISISICTKKILNSAKNST